MAEVQPLADLAVRQARGRHLGDLDLLRRELVARLVRTAAHGLARRSELLPGALRPRRDAECLECLAGGAQRGARLGHAAAAAQPLPVGEQHARAHQRPGREVAAQASLIEGFRGFVVCEQRVGEVERDVELR